MRSYRWFLLHYHQNGYFALRGRFLMKGAAKIHRRIANGCEDVC